MQKDLRRAYWKHAEHIISPQEADTNPYASMKRFWTFIKHKKSDFSGVAPLRVDGKLINDAKRKANTLNNQFHSVFTRETDFQIPRPSLRIPSIPPIDITVNGVLKLLKNLKPGKAAGPDNIGPRVLRELCDVIAGPLTRIFRKSLREGQVPQDWKHANITPIFKKGQKYDPGNYRPISLTCIASKLLEHIIYSSIMTHASDHNILYSLQHGFRPNPSCETQLLKFTNDIVNNMQNGDQTNICILEFAEAFDNRLVNDGS